MTAPQPLTAARLAEIRGRLEKATPGPWGWFGNTDGQELHLATVANGRRFVMRFGRWGFHSAQPWFQVAGRMIEAAALVMFEVGNQAVRGAKQAKQDDSVYRRDVRGIDHPDADLIAHAPADIDTLLAEVERLRAALLAASTRCMQGSISGMGREIAIICAAALGVSPPATPNEPRMTNGQEDSHVG